jgi:hypothetical protein
MPTPRPWTVTPHDPIEKIDDNLWALSSPVPGMKIHRRMCIVRRDDGRLLFYNAVPMDERTLDEIKAWGNPSFLVLTHDQHMIDGDAFRQKLGVSVYCPKATSAKVRLRTTVTGEMEDLPGDPAIGWDAARSTKLDEPVMIVKSGGGARASIVTSDVFQNNQAVQTAFMFRLMGFLGPKTPPMFKMLFLKDKAGLRTEMERWAATPNLARIIPSHGTVITDDPAGALRRAAAGL